MKFKMNLAFLTFTFSTLQNLQVKTKSKTNFVILNLIDLSGAIEESDEMKPNWFKFEDLPFDKMWPDDKFWFPHLLKEEKFKAYFLFEGHDKILKQSVQTVKEF